MVNRTIHLGKTPITPPYTRPGDVIAFDHWWGMRGYSTATIGSNAIQLQDAGTLTHTQDIVSLAGGGLDLAAITSFVGSFGAARIKKFYDQAGGGVDIDATTGNFPPLDTAPLGGTNPAASMDGTGAFRSATTNSVTTSQPCSISAVVAVTGDFTTLQYLFSTAGGRPSVGFNLTGGANDKFFMGLSVPPATAEVSGAGSVTHSAWHSLQVVFDNTSSHINTDGVDVATGASIGATGFGSLLTFGCNVVGAADPWHGFVGELGIIASSATGSFAALRTSQRTFWGF